MALILQNGGSQSPDRWLKEPRNNHLATIYLMTTNLSQAKTHLKKAFKIYEKIWADEPKMIETKYREIQELYPQIGFSIGKTLSGLLTKHA